MKWVLLLTVMILPQTTSARCHILVSELSKLIDFPRADKTISNIEEAEFSYMLSSEPFENSLKNKFGEIKKNFYVNPDLHLKRFNEKIYTEFQSFLEQRRGLEKLTEKEIFEYVQSIAEKEYYITLKSVYTDAGYKKLFNEIYQKEIDALNNPNQLRKERSKARNTSSTSTTEKIVTKKEFYNKEIINFDETGKLRIQGQVIEIGNLPTQQQEILFLTDDLGGSVPKNRKLLSDQIYKLLDIDPYKIADNYFMATGKHLGLDELHGLIRDYTEYATKTIRNLINNYPAGSLERKSLNSLAQNIESNQHHIDELEDILADIYQREDAHEILSILGKGNTRAPEQQRQVMARIMAVLNGFKNEYYLGMNLGSLTDINKIVPNPGKEIDVVFKGQNRPQAWGEIKSGRLYTKSPSWRNSFKQFQNMIDTVVANNLEDTVEIHYFVIDGIGTDARREMVSYIEEVAAKNPKRRQIEIYFH